MRDGMNCQVGELCRNARPTPYVRDLRNQCERRLINGAKLSDCDAARKKLANSEPLVSTIGMAVTGSQELREGREHGVCLRANRPVIVRAAELIDDNRLMMATIQEGSPKPEIVGSLSRSRNENARRQVKGTQAIEGRGPPPCCKYVLFLG